MQDIEKGRDAIIDDADPLEIELDNGKKMSVTPIAMTEMNGKQYLAVIVEDTEEFLIYISIDHGETIELLNIEDEKEYELVAEYFENMINDDLEDEDYDDDEKEEKNN
ncbi:MAG: DUF1292 domain-containing protein [Candidatus Zophobacter franzmannii]|nr:DUF1292 domain-containing protein [Candidatus Zophobacter franzmannii]